MSSSIKAIIDPLVSAYQDATKTPGVAIAFHFQGKDHLLPYGHADVASGTEVTCDTIFEIGSMTKAFSATLLASQVGQGVISLHDAPYLRLPARVGEKGGNIKDVSYIQLATHTSTLHDTSEILKVHPSAQLFDGEAASKELIDWWIAHKANDGGCWQYSNTAFVTLGFAVVGPVDATGYQPYSELLGERITSVLGMSKTVVHASGPGVAQGYLHTANGPVAAKGTASDLKSSARDILAFLRANLGLWPGSVPADLAAAIAMTQKIYVDSPNACGQGGPPERFSMGLAWQVSEPDTDAAQYFKDGATGRGGFTSYMAFLPGKGIAIAVLTNLDDGGTLKPKQTPGKLANEILAALPAAFAK